MTSHIFPDHQFSFHANFFPYRQILYHTILLKFPLQVNRYSKKILPFMEYLLSSAPDQDLPFSLSREITTDYRELDIHNHIV